jgi:hypothetical protein
VAAATASAFGLQLTDAHVGDAEKILPIAFIAIFGTVCLYGLTALPVARLLGLAGAGANVVLIVGGHAWARSIAAALRGAGLGVRLWTGSPEEQAAAREAGLDAGNARLGVDLASREAELEEVGDALLVTASDDFNALAAYELRRDLGSDHVYRIAPGGDLLDLVPAYAEGSILFGRELTFAEIDRRFQAGAEVVEAPAAGTGDGVTPLFVVTGAGDLKVATAGGAPDVAPGDTAICLREARQRLESAATSAG